MNDILDPKNSFHEEQIEQEQEEESLEIEEESTEDTSSETGIDNIEDTVEDTVDNDIDSSDGSNENNIDNTDNIDSNDKESIPSFVNLHVHSEYSLVDGAIRVHPLVDKVAELKQPAIALTDHAGLYGCIDLYIDSKKYGINAIIGSEIYSNGSSLTRECVKQYGKDGICYNFKDSSSSSDPIMSDDDSLDLPSYKDIAFNSVLLSKNQNGYKHLVKVVSNSHINSLSTIVPIISFDKMLSLSEDIIFIYSCRGGEISYLLSLLRENNLMDYSSHSDHILWKAISDTISSTKKVYGQDNVYIELVSDNLLDDETEFLDDLVKIASIFDVQIVASSNAHYLNKQDGESHPILLGVKNDFKLSDVPNRNTDFRSYLYSNEDAYRYYSRWPESISNTVKIAEKCHTEFEFGKFYLPSFELPGENTDDGMERLAREGLVKRLELREKIKGKLSEEERKVYEDRLNYELGIIRQMGFCGYFLIVQDFINWAKDHGIPVGPGRGSGASSLVAYSLRITDLDPLDHNLIFERFLNPERISMPDFDVDFCQERREEVIDYVSRRYGKDCTAQITTFGKMNAKGVVRDVGRVLGLSYSKVDAIAKLIPNEMGIKLKDALENEPRIKEEIAKEPILEELMEHCLRLEGLNRHSSVHAAGVVISDGPIDNYVPVYQAEGSLITQYEMKNAEKVGLVKFDFLGLKTLTVINKAVKLINASVNKDFRINEISLEDPKVYELISSGKSVGVFQLESGGMKQLLQKLQPSCFPDLVALVALFRPGPLQSGMVDDFVERKHGRKKVEYPLPQLEPVLKETYGVIVYQEQVQKIAGVLANYTLGEADLLRRAMGKKKPAEMAKQKGRFIEGCKGNGISEEKASEIFDLMAKFAEYGFNKSHSAAYGLVSYQTAYLKQYYPEQFLAAIMSCDISLTDKIVSYTQECKRLGFKIIAPDINSSTVEFIPSSKQINFALTAIKGVGESSVELIVKEREKGGIFRSVGDLARRVNLHDVGKKTLELLTEAGAMDVFSKNRKKMFESILELVNYSENYHESKESGQSLLFSDEPQNVEIGDVLSSFNNLDENGNIEKKDDDKIVFESIDKKELEEIQANSDIEKETKLLGLYLSHSPLDLFSLDSKNFRSTPLGSLLKYQDKKVRTVCIYLGSNIQTLRDDKQVRMIFVQDDSNMHERFYIQHEDKINFDFNTKVGTPIIINFYVKKQFNSSYKPIVESISILEEERISRVKSMDLMLDFSRFSLDKNIQDFNKEVRSRCVGYTGFLECIKNISNFYKGNTRLNLKVRFKESSIKYYLGMDVKVENNFLQALKNLEIDEVFEMKNMSYEM